MGHTDDIFLHARASEGLGTTLQVRAARYACAVMGADGVSQELVQEIVKTVPCKGDRITIDELYDIFLHARASEGFLKHEKDFYVAAFNKFDADMSPRGRAPQPAVNIS